MCDYPDIIPGWYPDIIGDPDDNPWEIEGKLVDLLDNEQFNYFCDLLTAGKISDGTERFNLIVQMISRDSDLIQRPH